VVSSPGLPYPFGRYLLVEKIASGGMAEVFRAVLRGAAGFEKPLAVKRILPVFSEEPDFVTLFQDEARIASTLTHANIAQVFEFGEVDGQAYIALELVDGLDLGRVMHRLRTTQQPMPLATAAFIVAEAARGLAYAHEKRDGAGHTIGIVHRDVSPPNLLISLAGEVKVADFGIAKAANKVHKTETGVVMGKLRYMSPEQIEGEELDGRSDLFSLGVILYELLTSGPIYPGDQSFRLADLIRTVEPPPPSSRNPEVPPALDAIVMHLLRKRREERFARAAEVARELTVFVSTQAPGFTREDLGALVAAMAPGTAARAAHELPIDDHVDPHRATDPAPARRAVSEAPATRDLLSPARGAGPAAAPAPAPVAAGPAPVGPPTPTPPPRRRSLEAAVGLGLAAVILASGGLFLIRFALPGHDAVTPDARRLAQPAAPADAGSAAVAPPPSAPFTLAPLDDRDARREAEGRVANLDVTRRGVESTDYAAFLTGLDGALGQLILDGDGRPTPSPPLSPATQALVGRAGVDEAVAATLETVRRSGELPPDVRSALRSFLAGGAAVATTDGLRRGRRMPPFAAPGLALWLEPQSRAHLVELALANDALGRWCEPPPAPARHFAPVLCERGALIATLRARDPRDAVAEALERWDRAGNEVAAGDGKVALASAGYAPTERDEELELRVTLAATGRDLPAASALVVLAPGLAPAPAREVAGQPGVFVWRVPTRAVAPVLQVEGGALLRLPPVPFGR
jgi:hypothetical protein